MMHHMAQTENPKGWFVGPWNSAVPVPIGYANAAIDEQHYHAEMFEIYLIAKGRSIAVVDGAKLHLQSGDMLVVEPGEVHTFTESTEDYLHFVIQVPFIKGDKFLVK